MNMLNKQDLIYSDKKYVFSMDMAIHCIVNHVEKKQDKNILCNELFKNTLM